MNSTLWLLTMLGLSINSQADSTWPLPLPCRVDQARIEIQNKAKDVQEVVVSLRPIPFANIEQIVNVPPGSSTFELNKWTDQIQNINLKTETNKNWNIQVRCDNTPAYPLREFNSRIYTVALNPLETITVHLMDISDNWQDISLEWLDKNQKIIKTETFAISESRNLKVLQLKAPPLTSTLKLKGELRFAAWVFDQNKKVKTLNTPIEKGEVSKDLRYFLIAPRDENGKSDGESFTIALEKDSDMLPTFLATLKDSTQEKIIIGGVKKGSQLYNRAWHQKNKAPYSWFVHRVDALSDFAQIDCDGSPEILQHNLERKIQEGGRICFWRYRIIRELDVTEIESPP